MMRVGQYIRAERAIAAGVTADIRERWLYGLRLLADAEKIAPAGGLKQGVAARLVTEARARKITLSDREIQRRIQCARAYPTEAQIRQALADFDTWFDLASANFPAYERPAGEPDADYRTAAELKHLAAQRLVELVGEQGTLFPLDQFEPTEDTLKDLVAYAEEQSALTSRFVERDRKRQEYLEALVAAADDDLSVTWQDAHELAFGGDAADPSP